MKKSEKYLKICFNLFFAALVILLLWFILPKIIIFFSPFVIGWIISIIANPLVRFLDSRVKIVRKHSSMMIIILVLGIIIVGSYFAISKIGSEIVDFAVGLPELYSSVEADVKEIASNLQSLYNKLPDAVQNTIQAISASVSESLGGAVKEIGRPTVSGAGNFVKNIPSALIFIIFTILSSYFFIAERERILEVAKKLTPKSIQEKINIILSNFKNVVGGYFKAQFKIMGIVFLILFAGFLVLHVKYAILLALLIAVLDFLPFFGTGTALVPWAVFEILAGDYRQAIGLGIIYGVSQLVRQVIQPKIVGDTIGLNPLLTLFFMYIGYKFSGVFGMIIAVPVGVILLNLYTSGTFDGIISSVKEIIEDFNNYRKH